MSNLYITFAWACAICKTEPEHHLTPELILGTLHRFHKSTRKFVQLLDGTCLCNLIKFAFRKKTHRLLIQSLGAVTKQAPG